jgi:hypothetical protein
VDLRIPDVTTTAPTTPTPRRRWLQFSLRTLMAGHSLMAARWHRSRYVLVVVLLTCVIAGATYIGWAVRRALVVSHTAVFGRVATEWVTQYVDEHHGAWPPSWDALLDCTSPPIFPGHNPQEFLETLKSVVAIDFQAEPRQLAGQAVEQFTAIRSLDGYGVDDREYWDVSSLIQTLRKYHAVNMRDPAASPAPDGD